MRDDEPTFRIDAIRELMRRDGLNPVEFAKHARISKTLVGAWLSGVVHPQIGTLGRLCKTFNVPIGYFFTTWEEEDGRGSSRVREYA